MKMTTSNTIPEEVKKKIYEIILKDAHDWDDGAWIIPNNSLDEAIETIIKEFSGMKELIQARNALYESVPAGNMGNQTFNLITAIKEHLQALDKIIDESVDTVSKPNFYCAQEENFNDRCDKHCGDCGDMQNAINRAGNVINQLQLEIQRLKGDTASKVHSSTAKNRGSVGGQMITTDETYEGDTVSKEEVLDLSNVTRVELIEYPNKGRVYVNWNIKKVELSLQDDKKTLKVFTTEGIKITDHNKL